MLPLLDSRLGCRLMFLFSSTAMPVSVLLWIGAPFSFLLFPSELERETEDRKKFSGQPLSGDLEMLKSADSF